MNAAIALALLALSTVLATFAVFAHGLLARRHADRLKRQAAGQASAPPISQKKQEPSR